MEGETYSSGFRQGLEGLILCTMKNSIALIYDRRLVDTDDMAIDVGFKIPFKMVKGIGNTP